MAASKEVCLGYWQEDSDCEHGYCERCGDCYGVGYCTREYCAEEMHWINRDRREVGEALGDDND